MFSKTLFPIFIIFIVLEPVFGATCKDSTKCIASTYTSDTCDATSKVCACIGGAVPIRTGCGAKLSTPELSTQSGYSTVVLEGKDATLTCTSVGATLFEWTRDSSIIPGATSSTYTISSASASNVGTYSCKAKFSANSAMDSAPSNTLVMTLLLKTASTLTNKPIITLSTSTLFTGKTVNVSCTNIPNGYDTTKIAITDTSGGVTSPVTITDANKNTPVKCDMTDTSAHSGIIVGNTKNLPNIVTDISAVTLETTALDTHVYTVDETITLKCLPTPDVPYLNTAAKPINFVWTKGTETISEATGQTYDLPKTVGSSLIKCQATYTASFTSSVINITRSSIYLTKPVISADPTTPVMGSRLALTCGSTTDGATYSWKKDGTNIDREFEHIIQLDNLTSNDAGAYVCTVKRSTFTQISDAFNVSAGQKIVEVSMIVLGLTLLMSKTLA